jgi:flagellar basal body-associated protein FliL
MATTSYLSRSRFGLGATVWIIIVAVLLVVLAAAVLYFR